MIMEDRPRTHAFYATLDSRAGFALCQLRDHANRLESEVESVTKERGAALAELASLREAHGGAVYAQGKAIERAEQAEAELAKAREERAEVVDDFIDGLLVGLNRNGINTENWDGEDDPQIILINRIHAEIADAKDESATLRDELLAARRENEVLRKTIAQQEERLGDIHRLSKP